jgi:hypothetical protein
MTKFVLYEMKHIKNNITELIRKIDSSTEQGLSILADLAGIHDKIQNATDHVKAIKELS